MLLHLVDGTAENAGKAYTIVREELEAYGHGLAEKPEIVALSKADALTPDEIKEQAARLKRAAKKTPLVLSAIPAKGVDALRALLARSTAAWGGARAAGRRSLAAVDPSEGSRTRRGELA